MIKMNEDNKIVQAADFMDFQKRRKPKPKRPTKKLKRKTTIKKQLKLIEKNVPTIYNDEDSKTVDYSESDKSVESDGSDVDTVRYKGTTPFKKMDVKYAYINRRYDKNYIVDDIDPYLKISRTMYKKNYLGLQNGLGPCMIICGQSNSGKSVILNNLMMHKFIHEYEFKNIYFFSSTLKNDLKYRPVLSYMAQSGQKINYSKNIDFKIINSVIDKQEQIANQQMIALTNEDKPILQPVLFIFDDVMHDKVMKSFQSELSGFSM